MGFLTAGVLSTFLAMSHETADQDHSNQKTVKPDQNAEPVTIKVNTDSFDLEKVKNHYIDEKLFLKAELQETKKEKLEKEKEARLEKNPSLNDKGDEVEALQKKLIALGFLQGKAYGTYSKYTKDAVHRFQKHNDLEKTDGVADSETLKRLNEKYDDLQAALEKSQNDTAEESVQQPSQPAALSEHKSSSSHKSSTEAEPEHHEAAPQKKEEPKQVHRSAGGSVVSIGLSLQGVPYHWGGTTPSGFDCSGFLNYVFAKKGINLPRTAAGIYASGKPVSSPQPGDIVFFSTYKSGASHAGIYIGGGRFVHASSSHGVTVSSLSNSYWQPKYLGARAY